MVKGTLGKLEQKLNDFFYRCEYIDRCSKVSVQCRSGGNSYCGEYKKRLRQDS